MLLKIRNVPIVRIDHKFIPTFYQNTFEYREEGGEIIELK